MSAAVLYLAIVAIWAIVLVPRWLRPISIQAKEAEMAVAQQPTLEQRLERLSESMGESAHIVEQLSAELQARAATAKRLKQEAADAEALAAQNREQADAIRRLVRAEMTEELLNTQRSIFRDSVKIAIGSFVAGVAGTIGITLLIH